MYIFVNSDLKMRTGKISAQVGHSVQMITESIIRSAYGEYPPSDAYKNYMEWKDKKSPKIIIKATTDQLKELMKLDNCCHIIDAGRTQIPANSLTVVAFYPGKFDTELLEKYKILKNKS
jgi:Uncharacterized conserved protein